MSARLYKANGQSWGYKFVVEGVAEPVSAEGFGSALEAGEAGDEHWSLFQTTVQCARANSGWAFRLLDQYGLVITGGDGFATLAEAEAASGVAKMAYFTALCSDTNTA